jgi:PTS system galactitol-specific IIB component
MKTVFVVCATGIATSTMLKVKIEEHLRKHGIPVTIYQYRITELTPDRLQTDVIISTTGLPPDLSKTVPVLDGLPLITGVGEEDILNKLVDLLMD